MNRIALVAGGLLLVGIALALGQREALLRAAHLWRERAEGAALADKIVTERDVLDYLVLHPEQVSIAYWQLDREPSGLFVNADRLQPLAAASELVVLARYARTVAHTELDAQRSVSIEDWDRGLVPGSDSTAHAAAVLEARARGRVVHEAVRLNDVVRAMMRYGDPAAEDLLLARLGRAGLVDECERLGLAAEDAPLPMSGVRLSWLGATHAAPAAELLARYRALGGEAYAQLTWHLAEQWRTTSVLRERARSQLESSDDSAPSLNEQAQLLDKLSPQGSSRSYAALMAGIVSSQLTGSAMMRAELESSRGELARVGSKRGSLPGVLTSVTYALDGNRGTQVLSVFLQKLPLAVWLHLSQTNALRRFEMSLLQDEAFFALAKQRWAPLERHVSEQEARHANAH